MQQRTVAVPQKQKSNPKDISPHPARRDNLTGATTNQTNNQQNPKNNNKRNNNRNNNIHKKGGAGGGFSIIEDVPGFDDLIKKNPTLSPSMATVQGGNRPNRKQRKEEKRKQRNDKKPTEGDLDFDELFSPMGATPPSPAHPLDFSMGLKPKEGATNGNGHTTHTHNNNHNDNNNQPHNGAHPADDIHRYMEGDEEGCIDNGEMAYVELQKGDTVDHPPGKIGLEDFKLLKLIGQGGYGKVYQVNKVDSGDIFAMKVLRKPFLISTDSVQGTKTERDILRQVRHPFVVSLHYAFQTKGKVYLVMDYMNGGQLFYHLRNESMFSEDLVRFYIAELVLALEHLHSLGIMHRDLKPENILLDSEGHISVTDFGLAKSIKKGERTKTWCGTVEYMAPEMIRGEGYNTSADWWSVGVLAYDMLTGNPPFKGNPGNLQKKILTAKLRMPPYFTPEASSLIKKLLERDVSKRLGSGKGGAKEIKQHPFFKSVNWRKLANKEIEPPFRPQIQRGLLDTTNFDTQYTTVNPIDSPVNSLDKITNSQENLFLGFSYVRSCSPSTFPSPTVSDDNIGSTKSDENIGAEVGSGGVVSASGEEENGGADVVAIAGESNRGGAITASEE